jgi:hypothetical protein
VWCVFDVDIHPNLPEAKQQARDNGLSLAISKGVSILLCKRPGFGFGDGVPGKGAVPLPWPSDLEAPRVVMRPLFPGLACAPARES